MPPLVIASAHTQGTLVSFLQSFESCHGPIAPFSYFTSRFYLCGNVHVFFCTPTPKFESCCLAVLPHFLSFCSICMLLSLSLFFALIIPSIGGAVFGVYGGAAVICHWGLLIGVLSMHLFVCCICITGRASWWLLSRLNGLLASNWWLSLILSIWMSCSVSHSDAIPPHLHIFQPWFAKGVERLAAKILFCSFCLDICIYLLSQFCFWETGKFFLHPHDVS